ncbi:MAG: NAD(P)/FAD-dependent oxidoreductase, partial [Roseburia sp.]|nr:NAD(P)/FAD-dependent oxidoreductase [Roseburia sp.]
MIYDCIIIGKGPAGITASIYLKRYGYEPLIIAKDGGALEHVKDIENYYGISHITGPELLKAGENQAKAFDIPIKE